MDNSSGFCCRIWSVPWSRSVFLGSQLLLSGMSLSGCGGSGDSSQPTASTPALMPSLAKDSSSANAVSQRIPASANLKPSPPAANDAAAVRVDNSARLARLRKLPLLSLLSERERAGLLEHLADASPSERLTSINQYPKLAGLPDQQKQILLDQLEIIAPMTIPQSRIVCNCGSEIKRELRVPERCSNNLEIQSICNQACGTLSAFKSECFATKNAK